ncbi:phosphopantetheine-binding protein [Nonomuraea sp. NPDC003707]
MDPDNVVTSRGNTSPVNPDAGGQILDLRQTVETFFARALQIPGIGEQENFFELGGDSLSAAHLIHLIKTELRSDLKVRDFYRDPTVTGLMKIIAIPESTRRTDP